MTEHVAHAHDAHGTVDPAGHEGPAGEVHHGHDNSPEAIRKETRRYIAVLIALMCLTGVTVGISYIHLPTHLAIILALVVATIKGSLVAAFFMHLISERKLIYAVLLFTVFFFGMLLWGPWHQRSDAQKQWKGYDLNASSPAPKTPTEGHGHGAGH
jgi:caa(3)-type oxidase subunit IV